MWSKVYGSVRRPSVCLSTAANVLLHVCYCGPSWQEILIDCCMAHDSMVGECGQCHVVSICKKLNKDLLKTASIASIKQLP